MIAVFGSINIDLVTPVERIAAPGETVMGDAYRTISGGKGANQALAARRAGAQVAMIAAVGRDGTLAEPDELAPLRLPRIGRDGQVDRAAARVAIPPHDDAVRARETRVFFLKVMVILKIWCNLEILYSKF